MEIKLNKRYSFSFASICILTVTLIAVFFLTYFSPWMGDEIFYMFKWTDNKPIASISDIIESQNYHYLVTNGRYSAHFLVQLIVGYLGSRLFFAFLNTIVWGILLFLTHYFAKLNFNSWKQIIILVSLLFIDFSTIYAPSCQIGYIWCFAIVLTFIYVFFNTSKLFNSKFWIFVIIPFGLIVGNFHESINPGFALALFIYALRNIKKLTIYQWLLGISFAIGFILLCVSPGNIHRASLSGGFFNTLYHLLLAPIFFLFIFYILFAVFKRKINMREWCSLNWFWLTALIGLIIFHLFIGVSSNRQVFGLELISIILLFRTYNIAPINNSVQKRLLIFLVLTLGCIKLIDNIVIEYKTNRIYYDLKAQFKKSSNGVVYADIPRRLVYNTFTPTHTYHFAVKYSLGRLWNDEYHTKKKITVLPLILKDDTLFNKVSNEIEVITLPDIDSYLIIVPKNHNIDNIKIKRQILLKGKSVTLEDKLSAEDLIQCNENNNIYQYYEKFPFVRKVDFIQKK